MRRCLLSLLFIIGLCTLALNQGVFNQEDEDYFQKQLPRYQTWLTYKGIAEAFVAHEVLVDSNVLTLILVSTDPDAGLTRARWEKLQSQYSAKNKDTFQDRLFKRFCQLMEVPPEMAVIEVYNEISSGDVPCFYRGIYYEKGKVQVEIIPCMNQTAVVTVDAMDLDLEPLAAHVSLGKKVLGRKLEKEIRKVVDKQFKDKPDTRVDYLSPGSDLVRFEVTGLQREVLTDEANPILARVLNTFGLKVDWVKREFLTFQIRYLTNEQNEVEIAVEINGKYGSGFHRPRRNAYIDMEPEFEGYLAKYADVFAQKIRDHLIRKAP